MMTLSERIQAAFDKNPLFELACELFKEGYRDSVMYCHGNENSLITCLNKEMENGEVLSDVARVRIRNYMCDLRIGVKKLPKG